MPGSGSRVWFDVLTPKQVLFFKPVIQILEKHGCKVLATSRRYREVEPLAMMEHLDLEYIGERGGKEPRNQLKASLDRQEMLLPVVEGFKPSVSVSVASADCARISFGLRIRHVAVNDSPHSTVAGRLSLPLSHHLLTPWIIPYAAWAVFGLRKSHITRYRALDPAAWLKRTRTGRLGLNLDRSKKTITVRLEESYAPYMLGSDQAWADRVLEAIADAFGEYNLVALCRYDDQLDTVKSRHGDRYIVPEGVVDGSSLLKATDVFVGMGGTMTAEAALSGVPTISAFQGDLFTERYLKSEGLIERAKTVQEIRSFVEKSLSGNYRRSISERAEKVLDSMEDPAEKVSSFLIELTREDKSA